MNARSDSNSARASIEPAWRGLIGLGAVSAFVYVAMIVVPIVLLIVQPQVPLSGGAAILEYIGTHRSAYLAELVCFVGLSVPALFVFLALGVALWPYGKGLALLGGVVGVGSELIALALGSSPPSLNGGLLLLSDRYADADAAIRPSLATAAEALAAYANAISWAGVLTALGILLFSILMTKGGYPKWIGIVGIVTGALGIVCEAFRDDIGAGYAIFGLLLPLWFVLVGLGLFRIRSTLRAGPALS